MPRQSWQRRRCARLLVLLFTGVCGAADAARPNILLILADDLGISDLSSFRLAEGTGPAITPTIDRLAREGLRFGRFYSDASCAATRAGLLTGRYPASLGFRPAGAGIDPGIVTLPERLREAGYTTRLIGKWHLGYDDREAWPLQQGFDRFYGFLNQFFLQRPSDNPAPGRPGYVDPWLQDDNETRRRVRGHLSWLLADAAEAAIREGAADDDPWFLAFWPYAPHDPPQPPGDIASRFEETPAGRHRALIATLDRQVERLLATLEESGQRDRTLIVFASDNGATARHGAGNAPLEGSKGFFYEGGLRVPLWLNGPGLPREARDDRVASYLDLMPTLLAVAGAAAVPDLPGRNLLGRGNREEPLFWSSGSGAERAWSVLSADGQWRLTRDGIYGEGALFSVRARTASVPASDAAVTARLRDAQEAWSAATRRVALHVEPVGTSRRRVRSHRFQRAPGIGAHTMALCVRFPEAAADTVLASQAGLWSLSLADGELRWDLNTLSLAAPAPRGEEGRLLLVSEFNPSLAFPGQAARMQIYWNDRLLASASADRFPLQRDISAPLLVGSEDAAVKLGAMGIWNDVPPAELLTAADADAWQRWSGAFACTAGRGE